MTALRHERQCTKSAHRGPHGPRFEPCDRIKCTVTVTLVLDFAREFLPKDFDEVRYIFSKRGAYPKFRALLARRKAVDRWHEFESKATERALRDWCELNSIAVVD